MAAKPQGRSPRTAPPPTEPAAAAPLAPAPNNGRQFTLEDQGAGDGKEKQRQLGVRVPESLYDRLSACSEDTGVPIARLVRRAVEAEVSRLESAADA